MKNIKNKNEIEMAKELLKINELRKELSRKESEIKDYFKAKFEGESAVKLGEIILLLTESERRSLDRKSLEKDLGIQRVRKYEILTNYVKLEVKKSA